MYTIVVDAQIVTVLQLLTMILYEKRQTRSERDTKQCKRRQGNAKKTSLDTDVDAKMTR
jgi:hypothetical protein